MLPGVHLDSMESIWEALEIFWGRPGGRASNFEKRLNGQESDKKDLTVMNINSIVIGTFFLLGKYLLVPRGFPMSFEFKSFHSYFLSNHVSSEIPDSATNMCPHPTMSTNNWTHETSSVWTSKEMITVLSSTQENATQTGSVLPQSGQWSHTGHYLGH